MTPLWFTHVGPTPISGLLLRCFRHLTCRKAKRMGLPCETSSAAKARATHDFLLRAPATEMAERSKLRARIAAANGHTAHLTRNTKLGAAESQRKQCLVGLARLKLPPASRRTLLDGDLYGQVVGSLTNPDANRRLPTTASSDATSVSTKIAGTFLNPRTCHSRKRTYRVNPRCLQAPWRLSC